MTGAWIAAATAIVVALVSAFLAYNNTRRLSRVNEQITFVNRQLSEFYGPLLALQRSNTVSWKEFRKIHGADRRSLFSGTIPPDERDVYAWRYWLKHVFMPTNRRMYDIILTKSDLIEGAELPQIFSSFCAHVTGYEVTLAQWEDNDYSRLVSVNNHPGPALEAHIEAKYRELKLRQQTLLGKAPLPDRRKSLFAILKSSTS